jgi:long-subunit acyl-CoA synthetase (AMP-forming)
MQPLRPTRTCSSIRFFVVVVVVVVVFFFDLLEKVHFCFEPLALAASRINCYNVVLNGGRIDVFSGNFDRFWTEIRHSSPSWFSATPRIWNWCYR